MGKKKDPALQKLEKETEMAALMSVTKRTMRRYRVKGIIPFYRIAGIIRYDRDQVVRALNKFRVGDNYD